MLSGTVRVRRKLRGAGVGAELHIYEDQIHAEVLKEMNTLESFMQSAELNVFALTELQRLWPPATRQALERLGGKFRSYRFFGHAKQRRKS
jgi:acetyl esterase/lipase